jgi:hypothetical protein
LEQHVKRREPSGERSSEPAQGLRAQLSRAVGGSLDALRSVLSNSPKSVDVSKQRLSDVLWNDRTLLATHASASARAAQRDERDPQAEAVAAEIPVEADTVHAKLVESEPERSESPADSAGARLRAEARRSEVMRARLEATKARLATRLSAIPEGVAPAVAPAVVSGAVSEVAPEVAPGVVSEVAPAVVSGVVSEVAPEVASEVAGVAGAESNATWLTRLPDAELPPEAIPADRTPPALPQPVPAEPPAPEVPDPPVPARAEVAPPSAAATPRDDDEGDDDADEEPIRTRSMARLLASQGHRNRALKIYDALLAANGGDAELRAEAEALRRSG